MDDETRQFLTEKVLGECWYVPVCAYCGSPNKDFALPLEENRTFSTRDDMMDLYQEIEKAGKWDDFDNYSWNYRKGVNPEISHTTWLFCLSGVGYEDRCQMVSEFWKEAKDD